MSARAPLRTVDDLRRSDHATFDFNHSARLRLRFGRVGGWSLRPSDEQALGYEGMFCQPSLLEIRIQQATWYVGVVPKDEYPSPESLVRFKTENPEEFASRADLQVLERQIQASGLNPFTECSNLKEWVMVEVTSGWVS